MYLFIRLPLSCNGEHKGTIHVVLTCPILGFNLNFKAVNSVAWFCSDRDSFARQSLDKYNHRTAESCGGDEEVGVRMVL